MSNLRILTLAGLLVGLMIPSVLAQEAAATAESAPSPEEQEAQRKAFLDKIESFGWKREGKGQLGSMAEVQIPKDWRFTDGNGTRELLKLYGNLVGDTELGMLTTEGEGPWVIFEFEDSGYVKDDEKDQLNADEMLATLREIQDAGNERRREMGLGELQLLGWAVAPRFNDQTKNLEWAIRVGSANGESINYSTRLLGRHGVMKVDLVCTPEELTALMTPYQSIISGYQYLTGNSYAEFREGDKVAKYGLTALVAGGAAVAAGKMGLFAKLGGIFAKMGKAVILVVVAVGAAIKGLFGKLFGKREQI
ncbi:Uncharacterized membrane-anchored protein [Prosthecobacter debontii]|uniref:Uncharacterized membrane-anchored protein n=1 Tax=Prosthecobacter debontii TaxID=48467 RepID=A0A1T4Y5H5_9BACT|nr:DUF2167 domain-containing protein [Prosthecobacter debontii]SKA96535.1 Uncharacterized membrane-anchored protein [Prosthecobacter debontii]